MAASDGGTIEWADQGFLDVPGGRVWFGRVGDGGVPLLCLHGGPGFPHDYLTPLAALADGRQVVFYDQLGCGRSERPEDESLWTVDRSVRELAAVRAALELERFHLFGSSWGGMLALQYVLDERPPAVSLILASGPASMPRFARHAASLRAALPSEVQSVLDRHERAGFTNCPEYQAAVAVFLKRHICRLDPWPVEYERALDGLGVGPYATMNGPSEFAVVGNLKDWDVTERLGEVQLPTLITGGRFDECPPDHLQEMRDLIDGSELVLFEESSHLAMLEERDAFLGVVRAFLERVEAERPAG